MNKVHANVSHDVASPIYQSMVLCIYSCNPQSLGLDGKISSHCYWLMIFGCWMHRDRNSIVCSCWLVRVMSWEELDLHWEILVHHPKDLSQWLLDSMSWHEAFWNLTRRIHTISRPESWPSDQEISCSVLGQATCSIVKPGPSRVQNGCFWQEG